MPTSVIAGARRAGAKAAEALRDKGVDGEITVPTNIPLASLTPYIPSTTSVM